MNLEQILRNRHFEKNYALVKIISADFELNKCEEVFQRLKPYSEKKKLRIAYIMNHVRVCGGVKIILEHANQLTDRGHDVFLVCRDQRPNWMTVKAKYIQAKKQMGFVQSIPEVDIIICTTIDQVPECYALGNAPIVLFEQGDTYIYEFGKVSKASQKYFEEMWEIPVPVFGVSKVLLDTLYKNFGRKGHILHNALNKKCFYPKSIPIKLALKPKIIFVGQEENEFKGISVIRKALKIVKESGRDFEEVWVTQTAPKSGFDGNLIVNPSQEKLGEAYRSSDIFVSGSYYESFPLPPLEAMACGCAVVSTDNEGIKEYAVDGENCLLGTVGDQESLAACIIKLIDNEELRLSLVENGYRTAGQFDWKTIMAQWEQYLYGAIHLWSDNSKTLDNASLRIETLPRYLKHQEALEYIESVQMQMEEAWCLWLVEGEGIEERSIDYIRQILSQGLQARYAIQVIYPNDMPGHNVVRLENRLVKKGDSVSEKVENLIVLPIQIHEGTELYFSPQWIKEVKSYYLYRDFNHLIEFVKKHFSTFSQREQLIALKWVVLSLVEVDQYNEAFQVLNDAFQVDPSYSDLLYLGARLCFMLEKYDEAMRLLELANFSGTSIFHGDAIFDMEGVCHSLLDVYVQSASI